MRHLARWLCGKVLGHSPELSVHTEHANWREWRCHRCGEWVTPPGHRRENVYTDLDELRLRSAETRVREKQWREWADEKTTSPKINKMLLKRPSRFEPPSLDGARRIWDKETK